MSYLALSGALHALRDRLPRENAAHLAAQRLDVGEIGKVTERLPPHLQELWR